MAGSLLSYLWPVDFGSGRRSRSGNHPYNPQAACDIRHRRVRCPQNRMQSVSQIPSEQIFVPGDGNEWEKLFTSARCVLAIRRRVCVSERAGRGFGSRSDCGAESVAAALRSADLAERGSSDYQPAQGLSSRDFWGSPEHRSFPADRAQLRDYFLGARHGRGTCSFIPGTCYCLCDLPG